MPNRYTHSQIIFSSASTDCSRRPVGDAAGEWQSMRTNVSHSETPTVSAQDSGRSLRSLAIEIQPAIAIAPQTRSLRHCQCTANS